MPGDQLTLRSPERRLAIIGLVSSPFSLVWRNRPVGSIVADLCGCGCVCVWGGGLAQGAL